MSKTIKAKVYCIAAGCRNNNKNSDLSFFALPSGQSEKETERCEKWLQLLGREDILERQIKRKNSFRVCSAHFEASSMKIMRMLTTNAYPTLLLPSQPQAGPSCSTAEPASSQSEDAGEKDAETQTGKKSLEQPTETSTLLTKGTPMKRKLLEKQKAKKVKKWYYEPGDESP